MRDENQKKDDKSVHLKVEGEKEQGAYSNAVSVHVNQNEAILDFGYLLPNQSPLTIKLVSRINLSHRTAESLMSVLTNAMLDWRNAQKKQEKKHEE